MHLLSFNLLATPKIPHGYTIYIILSDSVFPAHTLLSSNSSQFSLPITIRPHRHTLSSFLYHSQLTHHCHSYFIWLHQTMHGVNPSLPLCELQSRSWNKIIILMMMAMRNQGGFRGYRLPKSTYIKRGSAH